MMDNNGQQNWRVRLEAIVSAWPKAAAHSDPIPATLEGLVTDDFDHLDLLHRSSGVAEVSKVEVDPIIATVEFLDTGGTYQRAVFRSVGPHEWKLQSLKFQCSICFGSGTDQGKQCLLCEGKGWGAG